MLRDFHITPVLNGFIVEIGCQKVVFSSRESMMRAIDDYLNDPQLTWDNYSENSLNSKYLLPDVIERVEPPRYEETRKELPQNLQSRNNERNSL